MSLILKTTLLFFMMGFNFSLKAQGKRDSCKITINSIGDAINTPYDEFAPIISADGLMMIFTSNQPATKSDIEKRKQGFFFKNIFHLTSTTCTTY